jgi:hypothetical protein
MVLKTQFSSTFPVSQSVTLPASFVVALVDFSRIDGFVGDSPGTQFHLPSLRRMLISMNVRVALFSAPDDSTVYAASRLGFSATRTYSCRGDWLAGEMQRALAHAEENGPLDLILIGADCRDIEDIRRLRASGCSVIVVNWPSTFDLELVQTANKCVALTADFIIVPSALTRRALQQAI